MDPVQKKTIEHFTHPGHWLEEVHAETEYLCDGCKTFGHGTRYRCCNACDFDLHEYCGTCPRSLSSFMHPHPLTLLVWMPPPQGTTQKNERYCNVCCDPVEGLFYRCKGCDFDVHPLCTLLPQQIRHPLHQVHPLTFEKSMLPGWCVVCGGACASWRFRCGVCGFDIHLECVLAPPPCDPTTQPSSVPPWGPTPLLYPPPPPSPPLPPTQCSVPPWDLSSTPSQYPPQLPPPTQSSGPSCRPTPPPYPPQPPPPPPMQIKGIAWGPTPPPPPYQLPPHYGAYAYGVPYGSSQYYYNPYNCGNQQAHGVGGKLERIGKRMFNFIEELTVGVVSNLLYAQIFPT